MSPGSPDPNAWRVKVALALLVVSLVLLLFVGELAMAGKDIPAVLGGALTVIVTGVVGLLAYHAGSSSNGPAGGGTP